MEGFIKNNKKIFLLAVVLLSVFYWLAYFGWDLIINSKSITQHNNNVVSAVNQTAALAIFLTLGVFIYLVVKYKNLIIELEENKNRYSELLRTANDAIFIADAQSGVIVEANKKAAELLGLPLEKIIGMHQSKLHPVAERDEQKKMFSQAVGQPNRIITNVNLQHSSGKIIPVEVSVNLFTIEGKQFIQGIFRDVTERKLAEKKAERDKQIKNSLNNILKISLTEMPFDQQLEHILKAILSSHWIALRQQGSIFLAEKDQDVLINKTQVGLPKGIDETCQTVPFGKCLCGQAALTKKIVFVDSSDDERHIVKYEDMTPHGHYCVPILSLGKVLGVINLYVESGHKRDSEEENFFLLVARTLAEIIVRQRVADEIKQANESLKIEKDNVVHERNKLKIAIRNIGDGLIMLDEHKRVVMVNKITEEMSGYKESELVGKLYTEKLKFINEKDGKLYTKFIDNVYITGKISNMENHTLFMRKDGSNIVVADAASPITDVGGRVVGCVVVFRDITKEIEVDKMKTEFVSLASHQLNTPLTGVKWFVELLKKNKAGKLNAKQADFVQQISTSTDRMILLVSELLDVSRIESGTKFFIQKLLVNFTELIETSIKDHQRLLKQNKLELIWKKNPKKIFVNIDAPKIKQVIHNLINNAVKYAKHESQIVINCEDKKNEVVFSIANVGLGIPKKQQSRVFEKFFRADNIMTTDTTGSGLGLYIAKSIIEAHGGRIWFKSTAGKKTVFYFSLNK